MEKKIYPVIVAGQTKGALFYTPSFPGLTTDTRLNEKIASWIKMTQYYTPKVGFEVLRKVFIECVANSRQTSYNKIEDIEKGFVVKMTKANKSMIVNEMKVEQKDEIKYCGVLIPYYDIEISFIELMGKGEKYSYVLGGEQNFPSHHQQSINSLLNQIEQQIVAPMHCLLTKTDNPICIICKEEIEEKPSLHHTIQIVLPGTPHFSINLPILFPLHPNCHSLLRVIPGDKWFKREIKKQGYIKK
jgi:hypothetical protein